METTEIIKLPVNQEKVILVELAKLLTEQSTYLLGELKQRPKMRYSNMVTATDAFVKEIEDSLSTDDKDHLQAITDALHDGMTDLRTDLKRKL